MNSFESGIVRENVFRDIALDCIKRQLVSGDCFLHCDLGDTWTQLESSELAIGQHIFVHRVEISTCYVIMGH